jgi:hypothetical protein
MRRRLTRGSGSSITGLLLFLTTGTVPELGATPVPGVGTSTSGNAGGVLMPVPNAGRGIVPGNGEKVKPGKKE